VPLTSDFNRQSSTGSPILFGSLLCRIESVVSAEDSAGGVDGLIPSYSSQTLSLSIVWMSTAWPFFSDVLIESDDRIGSIRTPLSQWLEVRAALGASTATVSESGLSFWQLNETEKMTVIARVSRAPSVLEPFSMRVDPQYFVWWSL
jgi:hypothetical protein